MVMEDEDALSRCVVCRTAQSDDSNILNTTMRLLISKCGHRFCDQCIKREFQHKREIQCPCCGKGIKKSQLQDKTLEELAYTKELSIRKKVIKDFNQTEENFESLDEYNDYLESVENLIFDLVSGTDEEKAAANKKWKDYRQSNVISIAENDAKKAEEERRVSQLIAEELRLADDRRLLQLKEDAQHSAELKLQQEQLNEVALGERDEENVLQVQKTTTAVPIDQPVLTAEMEAAMLGFKAAGGDNPLANAGPQPMPVPGGTQKSHLASSTTVSKQFRKLQQSAGGYIPSLYHNRNFSEAWEGIQYYIKQA